MIKDNKQYTKETNPPTCQALTESGDFIIGRNQVVGTQRMQPPALFPNQPSRGYGTTTLTAFSPAFTTYTPGARLTACLPAGTVATVLPCMSYTLAES